MGIYSEYLDSNYDLEGLTRERKKQLRRISELRGGRSVLVFAADLNQSKAPISMNYSDLLPISDQLSNLKGDAIDLILETPGGSGEVAEDIVRLLRGRFESVAVVIPGWAKSAGTLIAMAADEILMEPASAIGPIDAQLVWQGKQFSADALLEGMEKIKREVIETGGLNRAYIPILQGISPGELQSAENALKFAKALVADWLASYKFRDWSTHSSTSKPVTHEERRARAEDIATQLCDHGRWLTHGRSIKILDLGKMRLRITDYDKNAELADAIRRYHTLLQMTFGSVYKVFETPESQIYRFIVPPAAQRLPQGVTHGTLDIQCPKCKEDLKVQANLDRPYPLESGSLPFPHDNKLPCPKCQNIIDLSDARRQIEMQTKRRVVPQEG